LFFLVAASITENEKRKDKEIEMTEKRKKNIETIKDAIIIFFVTQKQGKRLSHYLGGVNE
jgi:hypothetical protein